MNNDDKTADDFEYEYDLIIETATRLADLAMALCHYNDELAKQALGVAIGTLCAEFREEPCLEKISELAETQMNHILQSNDNGSMNN